MNFQSEFFKVITLLISIEWILYYISISSLSLFSIIILILLKLQIDSSYDIIERWNIVILYTDDVLYLENPSKCLKKYRN